MDTGMQWAAVVIVDHGDDARGELRTVGHAASMTEAMTLAHAISLTTSQAIGFTARSATKPLA